MRKTILATFLTILISCSKEDSYRPPSDPKEAILGKWELIEVGYQNHTEPTSENRYIEYLPDSILGWYYYDTEEYTVSNIKYWIDTLLHHKQLVENDHERIVEFTYQFYDDKMRLEYVDVVAMFDILIYQRKK